MGTELYDSACNVQSGKKVDEDLGFVIGVSDGGVKRKVMAYKARAHGFGLKWGLREEFCFPVIV